MTKGFNKGIRSVISNTTDDMSEESLLANGTKRPSINRLQFNIRKEVLSLIFKCSVEIIEDTLRKNMPVNLPFIGIFKVKRTRLVAQEELVKVLEKYNVDNLNQLPNNVAEAIESTVRTNVANRLRGRIKNRQKHNEITINFSTKKLHIVGKKVT